MALNNIYFITKIESQKQLCYNTSSMDYFLASLPIFYAIIFTVSKIENMFIIRNMFTEDVQEFWLF